MGKAYSCDHCGEVLKGTSANGGMVGQQDADTWLTVNVYQKGEGKKHAPDLCPRCHMSAILGVLQDLGQRL